MTSPANADGKGDDAIWQAVAVANSLAPDRPLQVEVAGRVLVVGVVDGRYYALDDRCPHAAAPLSMGTLDRGRLVCPVHGWKFDVFSGHCELFNAQARTHRVRVSAGTLEVCLDRRPVPPVT
jgi:nitrite reductase/ring-hydroxylating ferredoxin subunit